MYERVLHKTFVGSCAREHIKSWRSIVQVCGSLSLVFAAMLLRSNFLLKHRHGQLRTMRTRRARDNDEKRKISELN